MFNVPINKVKCCEAFSAVSSSHLNLQAPAMAQNIYDNQDFFQEYIKLPRQARGLEGAPEWPELRSLIPDLRGKKLLDLGCGFGWVCRWAREMGAEDVKGVDVSEKMLARANEFPRDPAITYLQADLETLELPADTYHVVFSSLTLHYLKNLQALVAQVYRTLTPGGSFIFSAEHPIWTAPRNPKFIQDSEGESIWPLDGYLDEGTRIRNWLADGVEKQHRTLSTYITILLHARFTLSAIEEWGPGLELIKEMPQWANERKRPMFFLVRATKPISN
jgi:ubiquinone/menaquinone biosynthesis C-methylase UbiE